MGGVSNVDFGATTGSSSSAATSGGISGVQLTNNSIAQSLLSFDPIPNQAVTAGQVLAVQIAAHDPTEQPSFMYSLDPGVPSGAAINPSTGVFSWIPTTGGTFNITVRATDNNLQPLTGTTTFTITVNPPLRLRPALVPAATVGSPYNQAITGSGGSGALTLTYTITSGSLPAGLTFGPTANALMITGIPTANGNVSFNVTATDSLGASTTQSYTLTINPIPVTVGVVQVASPTPTPTPPAIPTPVGSLSLFAFGFGPGFQLEAFAGPTHHRFPKFGCGAKISLRNSMSAAAAVCLQAMLSFAG
jgi:hypothetical protein